MKNITVIKLLIMTLLIVLACSENKDDEHPLSVAVDCMDNAFKQTYLCSYQTNEICLIKGVALEVYEYGRQINVIEDLKGNFFDNSSIFVWGAGMPSNPEVVVMTNERMDNILQYNINDTLIMFVKKIDKVYHGIGIEKVGDFATLGCQRSTLKYSNGYVTGNINLFEATSTEDWNELQKEWDDFLNSNEQPAWWLSKNFMPEPFIFAYNALINYDSFYFVKGLVLDSKEKYGKQMKLITDLKGNFPEAATYFTVWGDCCPDNFRSGRFDNLNFYNDKDTLLMLLLPVPDVSSWDYVEKSGDFETMSYSFSVLKLSNNYVNGYITSCFRGEEVMEWEKFIELIKQ